jgi:hypothetical protein
MSLINYILTLLLFFAIRSFMNFPCRLKRLLLFIRLFLWRLCSHYLFMSLFSPLLLVPPKSVTLGKPEPVRAGESLQV